MAINVAGLVPASIKSKNVATEDYVDTSVANIDISNTLNTNNNVFAQRLGYMDYKELHIYYLLRQILFALLVLILV